MKSEILTIGKIKEYQRKLSSLLGVSGYEQDVSNFILNEIETNDLADKAWIDALGNVLVIKEGKNKENRVLLDAHIDEIGFMVSHVERNGFLRFILLGNWDTRILLGQSVILKSNSGQIFQGIIGSKPPHLTTVEERKKRIRVTDMYIDIGMVSDEEVINNDIAMGVVGTLSTPFVEFPNGMVRGKAFDDRTACNVLLHLMMVLKEQEQPNDTVLFNFAVQEEIGRHGAITGAYSLKPTLGLAIENTTAGDVPGIPESQIPVYIGKGPAITLADLSIVSHPKVNERITENAKYEKIPFQFKKPRYGRTDAGMIQFSRSGVPSSVISVPCRYIHSPTSLLKLKDIYETIRLIDAFLRNPANIAL
ncbi:MAG: M42 family metallopeptidase [Promethearchaeota archaeon]|jgi:endoglucanase